MAATRETVLQLLKKELQFLDSGGYRQASRSSWRPAYIFEESPSCPNYGDSTRPHLCSDCWLMEFVPPELREEQIPCRFVQLMASGVTVDSLYRYGSYEETEETLRAWLQQRISEIESELRDSKDVKLA